MFGCIGKVMVLAVLVLVGAVAFVTRGWWEPKLRDRFGARPAAVAVAPVWEPATLEGAARARAAVESLRRPTGPVFVNVAAGDLVALALEPVIRSLASPAAAGPPRGGAAVRGPDTSRVAEALAGENVISIRGNVRMADLGGAASLGPLAGVLEGTQRIEVRGRPRVVEPGRAEFRVERIAIGSLALPSAAIGRVMRRVAPGAGASASAEAVALDLPRDVADIRVTAGRVTLYKAVR
jgi:hypothetical protein